MKYWFIVILACLNFGLQAQNPAKTKLATGWYYVTTADSGVTRKLQNNTKQPYTLKPTPIVTAKNFSKVDLYEAAVTGMRIIIADDSKQTWMNATEKATGNKLGFVINDKLYCIVDVKGKSTTTLTMVNLNYLFKKDIAKLVEQVRKQMR